MMMIFLSFQYHAVLFSMLLTELGHRHNPVLYQVTALALELNWD